MLNEWSKRGLHWDSVVLSFISRETGQNTQGRLACQRGPTDSDLATNAMLLLFFFCLQGLSRICCGIFRENNGGDYWAACERCEHVYVLSQETHAFLVPLFFTTNAKTGVKV